MKYLYPLALFITLFSCNNKRESIENIRICDSLFTVNEYSYKGIEDTCLYLLNNSINSENEFSINIKKLQVLKSKKDINSMLKVNSEIIDLSPNNPTWIIQRGLIFEIKEDTIKAQKYYKKGLTKFNDLIKTDSYNNYNFRTDYITALEYNNLHKKALDELNKLSIDFPNDKMVESIVNTYNKEHFNKSQILETFWDN